MVSHIVKRDEDEFLRWLRKRKVQALDKLRVFGFSDPELLMSTEVGWLLCLPKYESKFLDFDAYQLRFLMVRSRLRSMLKARQVGFSFGIAGESLSRCHLKKKQVSVCVSYNLDDAKEKIRLAKELHEDLPLSFQKKIVIDSKTEVGFASNSASKKISRIISYPSKAPRGKTGDIYLDELAFCQNDKAIYAGATALIARSGGQLTIGSTPLGRRGIFHSIHTQEFEKFPGYWRQDIPWWLCRSFCRDIPGACDRKEGITGAALLTTEERVAAFGSAALQQQFDALPIEDFQQEFELMFQDERVSFFPYDLIMPCCNKDRHEIPVYGSIEELMRHADKMGPLSIGFDVGRTKNPSELFIFEDQGGRQVMRYEESFKNVPFPAQRARLKQIGRSVNKWLYKFRIDGTGLGRNLGEDLAEDAVFGHKVEVIIFTMPIKEKLANCLKILLTEKSILMPRDRDLIGQIHSIKQKITSAGNTIFDAERNRHHHADKMWAIALAVLRQHQVTYVEPEVNVRIVGQKKTEKEIVKEGGKGLVERLFDVPSERPPAPPRRRYAVAKSATLPELKKNASDLRTSALVWKRSGDTERALECLNAYKRVRKLIRYAEQNPELANVAVALAAKKDEI